MKKRQQALTNVMHSWRSHGIDPKQCCQKGLLERALAGLGGASPERSGDAALAGDEGGGSVASWWLPHFSQSAQRFPHSKAGLQEDFSQEGHQSRIVLKSLRMGQVRRIEFIGGFLTVAHKRELCYTDANKDRCSSQERSCAQAPMFSLSAMT